MLHATLIEGGAVAQQKPVDEGKVVLDLEQIEVERVLSETGARWGFLDFSFSLLPLSIYSSVPQCKL